jgi:hypothetical protein
MRSTRRAPAPRCVNSETRHREVFGSRQRRPILRIVFPSSQRGIPLAGQSATQTWHSLAAPCSREETARGDVEESLDSARDRTPDDKRVCQQVAEEAAERRGSRTAAMRPVRCEWDESTRRGVLGQCSCLAWVRPASRMASDGQVEALGVSGYAGRLRPGLPLAKGDEAGRCTTSHRAIHGQ